MKTLIANLITAVTFNRIRFMHKCHVGVDSLRWFWQPWFKTPHGGWIYIHWPNAASEQQPEGGTHHAN